MDEKFFMTINEVSEYTTISVGILKKMVKNKEFPKPAIDKRRMKRWLKEDINKWFSKISTVKD